MSKSADRYACTEKPACERLSPCSGALRRRRHHDIWVLEGRQGHSRTEVRASSRDEIWLVLTNGPGSELAREKMWSRIHLIPLLTAEEDRDLVRRHLADQAREKELLGSSTSPYNSDRYVS